MQEADQPAAGSQEARAQQQEQFSGFGLNWTVCKTQLYFLDAKKHLYKSDCLYIGLNRMINLKKLQFTFDSWNKYPT